VAAAVSAPARDRRTQAERREATRTALLDAAVDCLAQEGYANTTTRRIAERAGVTPGALQHHFESKAQLLAETRRHIGARFAQQVLARGYPEIPSIQLRCELFLDQLWELFDGPAFAAIVELRVAARTDRELHEHLSSVEREVASVAATFSRALYPELADRPGFAQLIATGMATMRGLAMEKFVAGAEVDAAWPATRAHMLALMAQFSGGAGS
jgi:AcrR family transcriptional regulator